jgi:CHAT domain-containing protein
LEVLNERIEKAGTPSALTAALVARGDARRARGQLSAAIADLRRAVEQAPTVPERAYAEAALGLALAEAERGAEAEPHLRAAIENGSDQAGVVAVASAVLSGVLANKTAVETSSMRAARFLEARSLADAAQNSAGDTSNLIAGFAQLAQARVALIEGDEEAARGAVIEGLATLSHASGPMSGLLLGLGDVSLEIGALDLAAQAYRRAGESPGIVAAQAALGLGEVALADGNFDEAIGQTLAASRYATAENDERIGFSADWLSATALARSGRTEEAAGAFQAAFEGLRDFRGRSPLGAPPATSARRFAPRRFQLDYADFLLRTDRSAATLTKVRELAEDLKLDEIDDYFAERCTPARGRESQVDDLSARTAVLYPVVFDDRTEMIWTIGDEIGGYQIALGRDALRQEITKFRYLIDLRIGGVEPAGKALYDQIIGPIETDLRQADVATIVVAPDGPFRTLPFAALWDGEAWLGERYGLATILGLGLIDQDGASLENARVLAAGAEVVSDDYAALPSVPLELAAISESFGASVLAEDDFVSDALAAEVARNPYDIVHIATHAEFGATPSENFILTSDGKLDITRLEATLRARSIQTRSSVSLLTLSACNTASALDGGSGERAPLGLAGVGFRAGARSVLASLWPAEDASTSRLMTIFYQELRAGAQRAEALQRAQAALIRDPDSAEPFQWANFMLIGDWR